MPRRIIFVSVAVCAVALSITAGGFAIFGDEESSPTAYSPETVSPRVPVAPEAALASSLAKLSDTPIASAAFVTPPPGADARGLPWLRVLVRVTAIRDGLDIRPQWSADLLQGGILELSGTGKNQREILGGSTFDGILPSGSVVADIGGGVGDVVHGQKFSLASNADAAADVTAALERNGLKPVSVKIRRVLGPAPEVIASSADIGETLARYKQIVDDVFGSPPLYEGYYLELRDAAGAAAVRSSASFLTGAGRVWVAPEHEADIQGIDHG